MLKIIATDMDGTLLNDKKEMPKGIFETITRLYEKDIAFVVASGRQHLSLQQLYDDIKDDIIMIAGNGSVVVDKGDVVFTSALQLEMVREIVHTLKEFPDLKVTLCGLRAAYMFENNVLSNMPDYLVESHFPVRVIINDLDDLPVDEAIIQVAIFDEQLDARGNVYEKLKHLQEKCQLTISGSEWLDIMNIGVNKGVAIRKLQETLGATAEETMVFGDEANDYEMMQQAYYSYAMENAVPEIKAVSNFTAPSNEEQGVLSVIENFLAMTR